MGGRIEERAKNARSGELELPPKRSLRPALPFSNRCEHQQDSAVGKIGAGDDLLDPVENDGSGGGIGLGTVLVVILIIWLLGGIRS